MEPSTRLDVIVLAGGINQVPLYDGYTPGYKALLPIAGKPCLIYTLEALQALPIPTRICIVGPETELRRALDGRAVGEMAFVPGGDTLLESIFSGLGYFADSSRVLVTTADLPLITPRAITDFLAGCIAEESSYPENAFLAVVPQTSYTGPYANFTKGFNRFRDVAVCHGNLMLLSPTLMQNTAATARLNALYNARKNPVSAALALGIRVGLSYVLGVHLWHLISLRQMATLTSQRFHTGFIPVLVDHPEITIDIDEAADYTFVIEQLAPPTPCGEPA
ncbi:MAG: NTP transferase domain-containing protein [Armatimonadota bacterium]